MRVWIAFLLLFQADPLGDALKKIDETSLRAHVEVLAGDEFEGRAAGFPGNEKALAYIVERIREYGLKPAGEGGAYTQEFTFGRGKKAKNVVALLEGSDGRLREEYVVVSAHFDHVGKKGQAVRGQNGGVVEGDEIWNGADDNASGAAAVLEVARAFAGARARPKRSLLFCWWNAEEEGLCGSAHWTEHPTRPLERVSFDLNLDMVGRNPDRAVDFEGVRNAEGPELESVVTAACEAEKLDFARYDHDHEAMFRSDGVSFLKKGVPAMMVFAYWHDDYHRVTDHADRIDYGKLAKVARTSMRILDGLANLEKMLDFNPDTPLEGDLRPLLADLRGEVAEEGGFRLTRVAEGSAWEEAGLKKGDVVTGFGGEPLPKEGAWGEMCRRLRRAEKGETAAVEAVRDGEKKTYRVVFPALK